MSKSKFEHLEKLTRDELIIYIKEKGSSLTIDEVKYCSRRITPYGNIVPHKKSDKRLLLFTYTNIQEEYLRRFIVTSFISYVYQALDEYKHNPLEPIIRLSDKDNVKKILEQSSDYDVKELTFDILFKFASNTGFKPSTTVKSTTAKEYFDELPQSDRKTLTDAYCKHYKEKIVKQQELLKEKLAIQSFLNHLFDFDPNEHVRSAYAYNPKSSKNTIIPDSSRFDKVKESIKPPTAYMRPWKDGDIKKVMDTHITPANIFYNFNRFIKENYAELRTVTDELYLDRPDLELAFNPIYLAKDEEDATKFLVTHKDTVDLTVYQAPMNQYSILSPYPSKENNIKYYGTNTKLLSDIIEQRAKDEKLGDDIMTHRKDKALRTNIEKEGKHHDKIMDYYTTEFAASHPSQIYDIKKKGKTTNKTIASLDELVTDKEKEASSVKEDISEIEVDIIHTSGKTGETTTAKEFIKAAPPVR